MTFYTKTFNMFSQQDTPNLFERMQLSKIEKINPENRISCVKWIVIIGRSKVCLNCEDDKGKLSCRIQLLKQFEPQSLKNELLAKRVNLSSH